MFLSVMQEAINDSGLKVRNIVLTENKLIHHLKNLYSIVFLEEVNKSVSIDRVMEYKVCLYQFLLLIYNKLKL